MSWRSRRNGTASDQLGLSLLHRQSPRRAERTLPLSLFSDRRQPSSKSACCNASPFCKLAALKCPLITKFFLQSSVLIAVTISQRVWKQNSEIAAAKQFVGNGEVDNGLDVGCGVSVTFSCPLDAGVCACPRAENWQRWRPSSRETATEKRKRPTAGGSEAHRTVWTKAGGNCGKSCLFGQHSSTAARVLAASKHIATAASSVADATAALTSLAARICSRITRSRINGCTGICSGGAPNA